MPPFAPLGYSFLTESGMKPQPMKASESSPVKSMDESMSGLA